MAGISEKDLLSALSNLSTTGARKAQKILSGIMGTAADISGISGMKGKSTGTFTEALTGDITKTGTELEERFKARQQLLKDMGLTAQEATAQIGTLEKASHDLFRSTSEGLSALTGLNQGMQSLAFFSSEAQMELAKGAMVLEQYGVGASDLGGILDTAAMSFGATQKELTALTTELGNVVAKFPGQASKIAANFSSAQKSLLYDSDKIMSVFKRLQFTSTQTGVSFDRLTEAFGGSMDDFEGSSKKAGNLNAILGKSVFNSIDLLGKTEAERVETIIAGVKKNVNVESLKKNKFQLKSVAAGLGLTPDETRRLLSGKTTVEEALKSKESKDPRVRATKMLTGAMESNNLSIDQLTSNFKNFRPELENMTIALASATRQEIMKFAKEKIGPDAMASLGFVTPADVMDHVQKRLPSVVNDPKILTKLAESIGKGNFGTVMNLLGDKVSEIFALSPEDAARDQRLKTGVLGGQKDSDQLVKVVVKGVANKLEQFATGDGADLAKATGAGLEAIATAFGNLQRDGMRIDSNGVAKPNSALGAEEIAGAGKNVTDTSKKMNRKINK